MRIYQHPTGRPEIMAVAVSSEDYNGFISGDAWEGCTDQAGDFDAMREGYYGA